MPACDHDEAMQRQSSGFPPRSMVHEHTRASADRQMVSATASESRSGGSGCLAELELLAAAQPGEVVAEVQTEVSSGSGRRSLTDLFAGAASAQLLLGAGDELQGAALLREPDLADQGGPSPPRSHRMDFADVGSPPLEEGAPEDGSCLVYDLNRPAATPMLRLPSGSLFLRDAFHGAAGLLELSTVDVSAAEAAFSQQDIGVHLPAEELGEDQPLDGQHSEGRQALKVTSAPSRGGAHAEGGSIGGEAATDGQPEVKKSREVTVDGDVGHLHIRAFRPPRSPSEEPSLLLQAPNLAAGRNAAAQQPPAPSQAPSRNAAHQPGSHSPSKQSAAVHRSNADPGVKSTSPVVRSHCAPFATGLPLSLSCIENYEHA